MNDNTRALPDRTKAILSVDVVVPTMGRRVRRMGTMSVKMEGDVAVFNFRPAFGGESWRFVPSNSIACHALTVSQLAQQLCLRGPMEALWDEFEGHPVITITVALYASAFPNQRDPLVVAQRWSEK